MDFDDTDECSYCQKESGAVPLEALTELRRESVLSSFEVVEHERTGRRSVTGHMITSTPFRILRPWSSTPVSFHRKIGNAPFSPRSAQPNLWPWSGTLMVVGLALGLVVYLAGTDFRRHEKQLAAEMSLWRRLWLMRAGANFLICCVIATGVALGLTA